MPNKKILIIDDDSDILDAVTVILKSEKFTVVTAFDGKDGVAKFKKEKPDLVLCDMMMEKVDEGSKVAQIIRKEDKKVPIYLLSSIGSSTDSNIDISKQGFTGVFQKPVDPKTFISDIKKALKL